ncbi:MAG: phage tail protein I [Synergistaceae bacterium]|jgi:phage tail P2-like protein|nr:phage tail protein I [Synergistaceae bacterium]
MARDIYGISLRDVIPSSIASDPQIQAMIDALDPELQSVSLDTREALIYSRINELPEDVIDLLAWQFHVDFYEPMDLSLEIKRGLVKTAILVHKRKGTRWAVQELCGVVFGDTEVSPWFEYGGEPYHFNVSIDATLPSQDAWEKFFIALEVTKSVRDWLDAIEIRRGAAAELYYGLGSHTAGTVMIGLGTPDDSRLELCMGMGMTVTGVIDILQEGGGAGG